MSGDDHRVTLGATLEKVDQVLNGAGVEVQVRFIENQHRSRWRVAVERGDCHESQQRQRAIGERVSGDGPGSVFDEEPDVSARRDLRADVANVVVDHDLHDLARIVPVISLAKCVERVGEVGAAAIESRGVLQDVVVPRRAPTVLGLS